MARMPISKKKRIVTITVLYMNMMNHLLLMMMSMCSALVSKTNGNKGVNTGAALSDGRNFIRSLTKNKKRSKADLTEQLVRNMNRLVDLYQDTSSNIAMLARCFKHESVAAERRDKVLEDIVKLGGLTVAQKTRAAEVILSNPNKIDFLFKLDSEYKAEFVASQLV